MNAIDGKNLQSAIMQVAKVALPIAEAKHRALDDKHPSYFDARVYPSLTPGEYSLGTYAFDIGDDGFSFVGCDIFEDYYELNHRYRRTLVTWEEMENPEKTIAALDEYYAARMEKAARQETNRKRLMLKQLKKELGES